MQKIEHIHRVRLNNLKAIVYAFRTQKDFCDKYGFTKQYVNALLKGHRPIGEKAARTLEKRLKLAHSALDRDPGVVNIGELSGDEANLLLNYRALSPESKQSLLIISSQLMPSANSDRKTNHN